MIITRTPLRVTLCGGGTDIPSYYKHNGGQLATMAINKYIYITLKPDYFDDLYKIRYSEIEITNDINSIKNTRAREALRIHQMAGVEINTCADLSAKSGLGSSGSFLVGLLNALRTYKRLDSSPQTLAEEACHVEIDVLQEPVGKQDQYIAAFGGVKHLSINTDGKVTVTPLQINEHDLISNMRIYSLNVYRNASDILSDQSKMLADTKATMDSIKELGHKQLDFLRSGDFTSYGLSLDKYWVLKKQLSDKISIGKVDDIYEQVKSAYNVLGGKIIGAGGGGFLLLYTEDSPSKLDSFMALNGCKRVDYDVDRQGSILLGNYL